MKQLSKTILRHKLKKKIFWHFCWLPYLYTFSLYENASFIIVSVETEYISTRSWYRNINFLRDRIRRIQWSKEAKMTNNTMVKRGQEDKQCNDQKRTRRQTMTCKHTTQITQDWATPKKKQNGDELMCGGRINSYCFTSGTIHIHVSKTKNTTLSEQFQNPIEKS